MILAGTVSLYQLGDTAVTDVRAAERYPYVIEVPSRPRSFHEAEVIGNAIITLPLEDRRPDFFQQN